MAFCLCKLTTTTDILAVVSDPLVFSLPLLEGVFLCHRPNDKHLYIQYDGFQGTVTHHTYLYMFTSCDCSHSHPSSVRPAIHADLHVPEAIDSAMGSHPYLSLSSAAFSASSSFCRAVASRS